MPGTGARELVYALLGQRFVAGEGCSASAGPVALEVEGVPEPVGPGEVSRRRSIANDRNPIPEAQSRAAESIAAYFLAPIRADTATAETPTAPARDLGPAVRLRVSLFPRLPVRTGDPAEAAADRQALVTCLSALADPGPVRRAAACQRLGQLGLPEGAEALEAVRRGDAEGWVREAAAQALADLAAPRLPPAALAGLGLRLISDDGVFAPKRAVTDWHGCAVFERVPAGARCHLEAAPGAALEAFAQAGAASQLSFAALPLCGWPAVLRLEAPGGGEIAMAVQASSGGSLLARFETASPRLYGGSVRLWFAARGGTERPLGETRLEPAAPEGLAGYCGPPRPPACTGCLALPPQLLRLGGHLRIEPQPLAQEPAEPAEGGAPAGPWRNPSEPFAEGTGLVVSVPWMGLALCYEAVRRSVPQAAPTAPREWTSEVLVGGWTILVRLTMPVAAGAPGRLRVGWRGAQADTAGLRADPVAGKTGTAQKFMQARADRAGLRADLLGSDGKPVESPAAAAGGLDFPSLPAGDYRLELRQGDAFLGALEIPLRPGALGG